MITYKHTILLKSDKEILYKLDCNLIKGWEWIPHTLTGRVIYTTNISEDIQKSIYDKQLTISVYDNIKDKEFNANEVIIRDDKFIISFN